MVGGRIPVAGLESDALVAAGRVQCRDQRRAVLRGHHPQRIAPAEHVEVDVQRRLLLPGRGDPGVRAQQAAFLQVPERELHAVVVQRARLQRLGEFQHGRHAGGVVGGAVADVDPVVVRTDQQQRRTGRAAEVDDQVAPRQSIGLERLLAPVQAQRVQARADRRGAGGGVLAQADPDHLRLPARGDRVRRGGSGRRRHGRLDRCDGPGGVGGRRGWQAGGQDEQQRGPAARPPGEQGMAHEVSPETDPEYARPPLARRQVWR